MSPLARIRQAAACIIARSAAHPPSPATASRAKSVAALVATLALTTTVRSFAAAPAPAAAQPAKPVELAPNVTAQIAHSALLTVDGTMTADALQITLHRVSDKSVVNSDDVTVAVDGKNQSVTHEKAGGPYELPVNDVRGDGTRDVDVTVGHDGIREILSGKVTVVEGTSAGSLFRDNKQIAWWILNIVIVAAVAMMFSRKKG